MKAPRPEAITTLLEAARGGDAQALDQVFAHAYDELRRLARVVRQGRAGATLNTTALVHEAYAKLAGSSGLDVQNRLHFMRIAARAMRQVLVNAVERRMAGKRGGGDRGITLNESIHGGAVDAVQLLALEDALRRLEALDPRQGQIVECRFFAGLTIKETAEVLNVSVPTVNRDWQLARAWLARELRAA